MSLSSSWLKKALIGQDGNTRAKSFKKITCHHYVAIHCRYNSHKDISNQDANSSCPVYDQQQALFMASGTVPVLYWPAHVPFKARTEAEFWLKFSFK